MEARISKAAYEKTQITQENLKYWFSALNINLEYLEKFKTSKPIEMVELYFESKAISEKILTYSNTLNLPLSKEGLELLGKINSETFQSNLAYSLRALGGKYFNEKKFEECLECYKQALLVNDDNHFVHFMMAKALRELKLFKNAVDKAKTAIEQAPDDPNMYSLLGDIYSDTEVCEFKKAQENYLKYRGLGGDEFVFNINIANCCYSVANGLKAFEYYEAARVLNKKTMGVLARHMLCFLRAQGYNQEEIKNLSTNVVKECLEAMGVEKNKFQFDQNQKDVNKKLHIGYISECFNRNILMNFFLPFYRCHDRLKFKFSLFSKTKIDLSDHRTKEIDEIAQKTGDNFFDYSDLNLYETAEKINQQNVDILIDLDVLTATKTGLTLAYKPAPVQAIYLGYPNTSGLDTVDYILTDTDTIKPEEAEGYIEKPAYIEAGYEVYEASSEPLEVNPAPCLEKGYVTFGSFNHPSKLTEKLFRVWAKILLRVPNSKLLFNYKQYFASKDTIEPIFACFEHNGVERSRLIFNNAVDIHHHKHFYDVDILLDSTPYAGTGTTMDSLIMSVPIIAFEGNNSNSRPTSRILKALGLNELVGTTEEDYINIAAGLAVDYGRIENYRKNIRQMLYGSKLFDYAGFTASLEKTYEKMWKEYCSR